MPLWEGKIVEIIPFFLVFSGQMCQIKGSICNDRVEEKRYHFLTNFARTRSEMKWNEMKASKSTNPILFMFSQHRGAHNLGNLQNGPSLYKQAPH